MITCQICKAEFRAITNTHLRMHGLTLSEYINIYGEHRSTETKEAQIQSRPDVSGDKNPMYGISAWNKGKTKSTDSRVAEHAKSGEQHSQWKGGFRKHSKGYLEIHVSLVEPEFQCMAQKNNNHILFHRYIVAKSIGRPLTKKEIVHHKDENRLNNCPFNLELFSSLSEHMRYHKLSKRLLANDMLQLVKLAAPVLFAQAGAPCGYGPCPEGAMSCKLR
jgi:hypothetical protein